MENQRDFPKKQKAKIKINLRKTVPILAYMFMAARKALSLPYGQSHQNKKGMNATWGAQCL